MNQDIGRPNLTRERPEPLRYDTWYKPERLTEREHSRVIQEQIRQIFGEKRASTGRKFTDIFKTLYQLEESHDDIFDQDDVITYQSEEERKKRRRTLSKGIFEPIVVLAEPKPYHQREKREEGLNRNRYEMHLQSEVIKKLVTAGCSPILSLASMAQAVQLASGENWIKEGNWTGKGRSRKMNDEEVTLLLAQEMANRLDLDLENLMEHHRRVTETNPSSPTYINQHDQHVIPLSQGGFSQRPVTIASHWYEHMLVAEEALEGLIHLNKNNTDDDEEGVSYRATRKLEDLERLMFFAYQINAQAAELLRHSIPLAPSLSKKFILQKRTEIVTDQELKLNIINSEKLTESEKEIILNLMHRIIEGRGNIPTDDNYSAYTEEEQNALISLKDMVEEEDKKDVVNKLNEYINRLQGEDNRKELIINIRGIITNLELSDETLYLDSLTEEQYQSMLELQEIFDEDILIELLLPRKIVNVRPEFKYRLDLDSMTEMLISPYCDSNKLRTLLDILEEPVFTRIFQTGGPPRRAPFSIEQLLNPGLSEKVYGELRMPEYLQAFLSNLVLNEYYSSHGIKDFKEMRDAMFPSEYDIEPPSALQNVDRAAEKIFYALYDGKAIATIGDCDQDGFTSSINWKWIIKNILNRDIEQQFNTRIEGHAVQPLDLLNLVLKGNKLIIVNDTGSSASDVETFEMILGEKTTVKALRFFRENLDHIEGFEKLSTHEKTQIKAKLTRFLGERRDDSEIHPGSINMLLNQTFTTGEKYYNAMGRQQNVTKRLFEVEPLVKFIEGFKDVDIVVCDHHTPSIEAVEYFSSNSHRAIMVNPEWVREGEEEKFVGEMLEALRPDGNGYVDVQNVKRVQRKYACYRESDIVGTVTAGKVIERMLQLFSDDALVVSQTSKYYSLDRDGRGEAFRDLAEKFVGVKQKEGDITSALPQELEISLTEGNGRIKIPITDLWYERGSLKKIEERVSIVLSSLARRTSNAENTKEIPQILEDLERSWGIEFVNKDQLIEHIINNKELINLTLNDIKQLTSHKLRNSFNERVKETLEMGEISLEDLRFYLEYVGELPKSYFLIDRMGKKDEMIQILRKVCRRIDLGYFNNEDDSKLETFVEICRADGGTLKNIKKHLFDMVQEKYPNKSRAEARVLGNIYWKQTIHAMVTAGHLSENEEVFIDSFLKNGAFGLEFLTLNNAYATLGDCGSVGIRRGRENRAIVEKAMNTIQEFVDELSSTKNEFLKKEVKGVEPPIFRLIRASLRGTRIGSINWHLSRLYTHTVAAFINAMYRRAKDERAGRAKDFGQEAADFATRKSENEVTRRHRHTLPNAQEMAIKRREELLENIVKKIDKEDLDEKHPILIVELEGKPYVDPTKGFRGLIAGELATRYQRPCMVVVTEQGERAGREGVVSVSFRLPSEGNISTDMVQLNLATNPVEGVEILAHGGHPEASGGTWRVKGGIETLHKVLDPIFENFKLKNPDAGVVNIERAIRLVKRRFKKDHPEYFSQIEEYFKYINPFDTAHTIASQMYKQTNPYGVDMPPLIVEFELVVTKISRGTKNDGDDYYSIEFRDKRGNTKAMRLFNDLSDLEQIRVGDMVLVRAQPIMRVKPIPPSNMKYSWPTPKGRVTAESIEGQRVKPTLDIVKIWKV